jgi:hypothetical protein
MPWISRILITEVAGLAGLDFDIINSAQLGKL